MKKLWLVLAGAALVAFAACGDDDEDIPGEDNESGASQTTGGDSGDADGSDGEGVSAGDSPPEIDVEGTTTASGLQYFEIEEGSGDSPSASDSVVLHYTGWLHPDGPKFDSSVDRGQPTTFGVNGVIAGFSEGLQLMKPGGKARLIIPPDIAYAETGTGGGLIPPNATLIFDLDLIAVQ